MTIGIPYVEMGVEDLAKFVFIDNKTDAIVYLSMEGLETSKDLFYFCLDLFCKGLVYLFGANNRVDLDNLTMNNFIVIQKKLKNAGVVVGLKIYDDIVDDENSNSEAVPKAIINTDHINNLDNNLQLKEYSFILRKLNTNQVYEVNFDLLPV